jgi:lysophospholipase L1-like esterase
VNRRVAYCHARPVWYALRLDADDPPSGRLLVRTLVLTGKRVDTVGRIVLVALLLSSGWACSDGPTGVVPIASVDIIPADVTIAPGESRQLQARVSDASGNVLTGRVVQWTSEANDVASVSGGMVVGLTPGSATIRAVSEGVAGTAQVTVATPPITLQSIGPASGTPGQSVAVTVTGTGFMAGITAVAFGAGITVSSVSVTSATSLTANITVAADAVPGLRTVTVTNPAPGGGSATLADAFRVIGAVSAVLSSVTADPASNIVANGGAASNVTVTVRDAVGGAIAGLEASAFTVSVSGSAQNGTVTAGATPGTYGFTVTNTVAETVTVGVQVEGVTLSQSPTIQFVAGTATQLTLVTQPSSTAPSGAAFPQQPVVRLQDANGNAVALQSIPVTAAITTGGGALGGTATVTTDAAGVATFTNLSISGTVGARTLAFSATGLATVTSQTITLTAGAAAQIAVHAGDGQSATVGTPVSVAPAVIVKDAAGNAVAGVNVTFAVAGGGGTLAAGEDVVTNSAGIATAPAWTLGPAPGQNILTASAAGLTGSPVMFTATGIAAAASPVRIVTFGDSNTDYGYDDAPSMTIVARSYVSNRITGRLAPTAPNHANQLAGLIEARWSSLEGNAITAINHGIGGTSSGGGAGGGDDRHTSSAPNARAVVAGITRYEAEVLGKGYPWNGGEAHPIEFPDGPIARVNSFTPGANDFAYASIGTNDLSYGISAEQTITNLTWMVDTWLDDGHAADQFIITTLPPRTSGLGAAIPQINSGIRTLAVARGIKLVDLAAHTSDDNGVTWKSADLHVGDEVHYTVAVRAWIADQVVAHMRSVATSVLAGSGEY